MTETGLEFGPLAMWFDTNGAAGLKSGQFNRESNFDAASLS
jgi:hypothetical protein